MIVEKRGVQGTGFGFFLGGFLFIPHFVRDKVSDLEEGVRLVFVTKGRRRSRDSRAYSTRIFPVSL